MRRGLQLFQDGTLAACTDGRLSAGPLDLAAFLAQQPVQEVPTLARTLLFSS